MGDLRLSGFTRSLPMLPLAMSVSGALRGRFASVNGFFSGQSTVEGAFLIPIILLMLMLLIQPRDPSL